MSKRIKKRFTVFDGEGGDPRIVELVGRFAWMLSKLIEVGPRRRHDPGMRWRRE